MTLRTFVDSTGRTWDVWNVTPGRVERRRSVTSRPIDPERRRAAEQRLSVGSTWVHGWLAFETKGERRRLTPIPEGWDAMDETELERLVSKATPVPPSRRLIE